MAFGYTVTSMFEQSPIDLLVARKAVELIQLPTESTVEAIVD
jgi:hypothetical protein